MLSAGGFPVRWDGAVAVVTLPAEIDVANVREVDHELGVLLGMEPGVLVADMSGTRFADSSGAAALIRAWKRARVLGVALRIAGPCPPVMRVLRMLGADRLLAIYPSLGAALADKTQAS